MKKENVIQTVEKLPILGILVSNHLKTEELYQVYTKISQNNNLQLIIFTPKDILWEKQQICVVMPGQEEKQCFRFPDVLYNQRYKKKGKLIKRIEQYIGENRSFNRITFFNKWRVYCTLKAMGFSTYLPKTMQYNPKKLVTYLEKMGQVIIKPSYGLSGKKVYYIKQNRSQYNIYYDTLKIPRYTLSSSGELIDKIEQLINKKSFLIQEVINMHKVQERIVDLRVLVQKDSIGNWQITNGISRVAPKHYYSTNFSSKLISMEEMISIISHHPHDIKRLTNEITQLSLQVAKALEQDFGLLGEVGLDLAINSNKELRIIEVNGKPQKSFYRRIQQSPDIYLEQIYSRPIEYAAYLANFPLT